MAAPGLRVTYVDGTAYIGSDNSWKRLGIGDSVSTESTVRLDAGASLDIKGLGADLYLMQKGSYGHPRPPRCPAQAYFARHRRGDLGQAQRHA